jgi:hypothetical protein
LVDVILPYWADNKSVIKETFLDKKVAIGGLFLERCVSEVHKIIIDSYIIRKMSISHGIIGDSPLFGIENLYVV